MVMKKKKIKFRKSGFDWAWVQGCIKTNCKLISSDERNQTRMNQQYFYHAGIQRIFTTNVG